jgi:hypothetical protein
VRDEKNTFVSETELSGPWSLLRPRIADPAQVRRLLRIEAARWPEGLSRYTTFQRDRDGHLVFFRPVVWEPESRAMYIRRLVIEWSPSNWVKFDHKKERWERWDADATDQPLADIHIVQDSITPRELLHPESLKSTCHKDKEKRKAIVQAYLNIDAVGNGNPADYIFNSLIFISAEEERAVVRHIFETLSEEQSYSTQIRSVVHKFVRYGGRDGALERLCFLQGGPDEPRFNINREKPGKKSLEESQREIRNELEGLNQKCRKSPITARDREKFLDALRTIWAAEKLATLKETYDWLIENHYRSWVKAGKEWLLPTYDTFRIHANQLIEEHDLKSLKSGKRLATIYDRARVGSSSDLTGDLLEIVDIDGFQARVPIAVWVKNKVKKIYVKIVMAVSRLSGAILGWEIALKSENKEAFRRCIAHVYLPKHERAKELGLESSDGLLHGCADGFFVDNGSGASEEILKVAVDEMGLIRFLPPARRGDLKGVCEGVNRIMQSLLRHQSGGYSRDRSKLAEEDRHEKRKAPPVSLPEFESFLWRAIQHYNLYTNKSRLRVNYLRQTHRGITPEKIFMATQEARRARGMLKFLTEDEIFEKFVPWSERKVHGGMIEFVNSFYSSDKLIEYYEANTKRVESEQKKDPLVIKIKRRHGLSNRLSWIRPDGVVDELYLCDEDLRSVGTVSWKALELCRLEDALEFKSIEPDKRKSAEALRRGKSNQIDNRQQKIIDNAEINKRSQQFGGLVGPDVGTARRNADEYRQSKRSSSSQRLSKSGQTSEGSSPQDTSDAGVVPQSNSEKIFMEEFVEKLTRNKPD